MPALVPRSALALAFLLAACGGDTKTVPKTDEKKVEAKANTKEEPAGADSAGKKPRPRAPASEKARVADPKGRTVVLGFAGRRPRCDEGGPQGGGRDRRRRQVGRR